MPKRTGGMGAASLPMGGPGKKPTRPPTPFSGGPAPPVGGGPRAAPSSGPSPAMAGGFKKGGVAHHEKGGEIERPGKRERAEEKKEENKYAKGGVVIAGHTTHGMRGHEHPKDEGISKGADKTRSAGPKGADSRVKRPHSGKPG
jgi:hypothetical protein